MLGVIVLIVGLGTSLYFGGWVMFVGGIAGLIDTIRLGNFEGIVIAKNVAKIIFASFTTSLGIYFSILVGSGLMYDTNWRKTKKR